MRKRGPEGGVLTFVARVETAAGGSDSVLRGDEYTEVECFPSKVKLNTHRSYGLARHATDHRSSAGASNCAGRRSPLRSPACPDH